MSQNKQRKIGERAKRVRYLRQEVLRLTREKLSQSSGIPLNTLQNWERLRSKGLTEKGAERLIQAYRSEGIDCTVAWLLYGVGEKPIAPSQSLQKSKVEELIAQELQLFRQHNHNVAATLINDDAMLPCFCPGDLVAGQRYIGKAISKVIGLACIVELATDIVLVRMLEEADKADCYTLISANRNFLGKQTLENVSLRSAAPILWLRRRRYF